MPKPFTPKVVTANHLLVGDVIYQTRDGWSRQLVDAEVLTDEAHADLRLIEAAQQTGAVPLGTEAEGDAVTVDRLPVLEGVGAGEPEARGPGKQRTTACWC